MIEHFFDNGEIELYGRNLNFIKNHFFQALAYWKPYFAEKPCLLSLKKKQY